MLVKQGEDCCGGLGREVALLLLAPDNDVELGDTEIADHRQCRLLDDGFGLVRAFFDRATRTDVSK